MSRAAEGGEDTADGLRSCPSETNRQDEWADFEAENVPLDLEAFRDLPIEPSEFEGLPFDSQEAFEDVLAKRPLSTEPERRLREEATYETATTTEAKDVHEVVNEWRLSQASYRRRHIEFTSPEGETVRGKLQTSYQPEYGNKYYAKLKQLERAVEREFTDTTTIMLSFTQSNENKHGSTRCTADHMREVADGLNVARKTLHRILDGAQWEYAKVWEPHKSGYGHLHVAVFLDGDASAKAFKPVMDSYVRNTPGASSYVHHNRPCSEHAGEASNSWDSAEPACDDCECPVSVNDDVENLGTYISDYLSTFGEDPLDRPVGEQVFYATCWATGTRRLDFSNGAQDLIRDQEVYDEFSEDVFNERGHSSRSVYSQRMFDRWRRENRPEWKPTYGETVEPETPMVDERETAADIESSNNDEEAAEWRVDRICTVNDGEPTYAEPAPGGVEMVAIDGHDGMDPPKVLD